MHNTLLIGTTHGRHFLNLPTLEDVRHFIDNYSTHKKFFVGDLSVMSDTALSYFLKFLEEKAEDLECYASKDNLLPTIISRFQVVEKVNRTKRGTGTFEQFLEETAEANYQAHPEILYKTAPANLDMYFLMKSVPRGVKDRIKNTLVTMVK